MRTSTVLAVLAFSAAASAAPGGLIKKLAHAAEHITHVSGHVTEAANAAQAVGNAAQSFRNPYAQPQAQYRRDVGDDADLYARDDADALYAREAEFDDALWARADFEDLFARAYEDSGSKTTGAEPTLELSQEHIAGDKERGRGAPDTPTPVHPHTGEPARGAAVNTARHARTGALQRRVSALLEDYLAARGIDIDELD